MDRDRDGWMDERERGRARVRVRERKRERERERVSVKEREREPTHTSLPPVLHVALMVCELLRAQLLPLYRDSAAISACRLTQRPSIEARPGRPRALPVNSRRWPSQTQ